MTHLVLRLMRFDLRKTPGRTLAVAALLGTACFLPAWGLGAVLAFAVAGAATTGAIAAHDRQRSVLIGNGGTARTEVVLAIATILPAGLIALAGSLLVSVGLGSGPGTGIVALVTLVIPLVAAPNAALALRGADLADGSSGVLRGRRSKRRTALTVIGWAALGFINLPFMIACLGYRVVTRPRTYPVVVRAVVGIIAIAFVVGSGVLIGSLTNWSELAFGLFVLGPPAAVAVVIIGTQLLELVGSIVGRIGPRARIALTPLTGRSRSLGPVVAILVVVSALAVMDATVGASFGQREADHDRTLPTRTGLAGTAPDQAIGTLSPFVDSLKVRDAANRTAQRTGTRMAVLERLGFGATDTYGGPKFLDFVIAPTVYLGSNQQAQAPIWLGVVEPTDLAALGLETSRDDLLAGKVVLLNPDLRNPDGTVSVSSEKSSSTLPAVVAPGPKGGLQLPGGIVTRSVAHALGGPITAERVVVVPGEHDVAPEQLRAAGSQVVQASRDLPQVRPEGLTSDQESNFEFIEAINGASNVDGVALGDEQMVIFRSNALNEVPLFSDTREQGRNRLIGLGALALLVTVAGIGLALGATRVDDTILRVQGAASSLRAGVGAIQAMVMAVSASVLAAVVGIGLPALAFAGYNRGSSLPAIPLVVPGEIWVLLIGLPIAAGLLTGLFFLVTERTGERDGGLVDDLAW